MSDKIAVGDSNMTKVHAHIDTSDDVFASVRAAARLAERMVSTAAHHLPRFELNDGAVTIAAAEVAREAGRLSVHGDTPSGDSVCRKTDLPSDMPAGPIYFPPCNEPVVHGHLDTAAHAETPLPMEYLPIVDSLVRMGLISERQTWNMSFRDSKSGGLVHIK